MRQLALHASALNDAEYEYYTSSLADIADDDIDPDANAAHDDAHYERMSVGVREARAWLRGRYAHIPASTIDAILKFFSHSDSLSGSQFFAALRLVVHVDNGKQVDRSLAFVQAHPVSKIASNPLLPPPAPPPPPPSRRHTHHDPSSSKSVSLSQLSPAPTSAGNLNLNPFTNLNLDGHSTSYPQAPPQHPMLRVDSFKLGAQPPQSQSHNPFAKLGNNSDPSSTKSPPLPPRKPPPPVPPPMATSNSVHHATPPISVKHSTSPTRPAPVPNSNLNSISNPPPPPLPKLASHVTSTLIKQSLHASKVAQSLKKAEEQLEKERIMQVLKSSSGCQVLRNRSVSPGKGQALATPSASSQSGSDEWDRTATAPPLPRRRGVRMGPSPPQSTTSYDQVALAGVVSHRRETSLVSVNERGRSHSHPSVSSDRASVDSHMGSMTSSPGRMSAGLPVVPPPMHPDRRERDERGRERRTSTMSVHSGKSPGGRTTFVVDTAPFDSVYVPLVSPLHTGEEEEEGEDGGERRGSSVQTALPSPVTPVSPESPTRPTNLKGSARVFRSKSMYHSATPPKVPPPMRRKRPESVQVVGSSTSGETLFEELVNRFEREGEGRTLRRSSVSHSALSAPESREAVTLAGLQRTFASLQPKLDQARYKAEAGISRRGFIQGTGEERERLV